MVINSDLVPTLSPDIVWRVLDDGAVLVTPQAGNVRVLNEVGAFVWQLIDGQKSVAAIEDEIIESYDVSREQAQRDLHHFLKELRQRELIDWQETA